MSRKFIKEMCSARVRHTRVCIHECTGVDGTNINTTTSVPYLQEKQPSKNICGS